MYDMNMENGSCKLRLWMERKKNREKKENKRYTICALNICTLHCESICCNTEIVILHKQSLHFPF